MAPARMNGEMTAAWLARAYSVAAPSIVASQRSGDEALMSDVMTVRSARSPPKAIRASSIESTARSAAVTDPMNGLSLKRRWAYTMSRWRVATGTSTGSHTVPPEWCRWGSA